MLQRFALQCLQLGTGFLLTILLDGSVTYAQSFVPLESPWLRLKSDISQLKMDSKEGHYLSFVRGDGLGLYVVDAITMEIYEVSKLQVDGSYFWSPDGHRLIYRELYRDITNKKLEEIRSDIRIYDAAIKKSVLVERLNMKSGFLTFDPRDLRMFLVHEKGIRSQKLDFPDKRLARWQLAYNPTTEGRWIATQNGIIWATHEGLVIRKIEGDDSSVESFDISPDGRLIAWATKKGNIFIGEVGKKIGHVPFGKDPKWHPERRLFVYAAGRTVGSKIINYDIRISDINGQGRFLTTTEFANERWPVWTKKGKGIIYTKAKTTDLFSMEFNY